LVQWNLVVVIPHTGTHGDIVGAWNMLQSEGRPMLGPLPCLLNAAGTHPRLGRTGSGTILTGYPPVWRIAVVTLPTQRRQTREFTAGVID